MVESSGLLNRRTGNNRYRGFKSPPLRHATRPAGQGIMPRRNDLPVSAGSRRGHKVHLRRTAAARNRGAPAPVLTQRIGRPGSNRHDTLRPPDDFAPFPQDLPDPQGQINQWLENAVITPLSAREYLCMDGWQVGPRINTDSFWYWFENGGGWFSAGESGRRRSFKAGDLLLIPPGIIHAVHLRHGAGVRHIAVHFHAHVYGGINLLSLLGFPLHLPADPAAPYAAASNALPREYARQAPGWKRAFAERVYAVLLHIIRHHGNDFCQPERQLHKKMPRLLPALEGIEQRLGSPELAIGDLARRTGVSEVYLRQLFRQVIKTSPAAYIQQRRIERACALLRLTDKSIKQIAAETGFRGLSFFYHVFARRTGLTPARYRAGDDARGPAG